MNDDPVPILTVDGLNVRFRNGDQSTAAVKNLSFNLYPGDKLGVVGESGSGKTVTSLSILNLLSNQGGVETEGSIAFSTYNNLLSLPSQIIRTIRGRKISMVFQEPMSSLNPVRKCGNQVAEILKVHNLGNKATHKQSILELFRQVSLPDVERMYDSYPHELSGGQLQRINIAMALATEPDIIICDEPTTALDVTVQSEILGLLDRINRETNIAIIFISHDLDVIASLCNRIIVMYKGEIVEEGSLPECFENPQHAYTKALIACKPSPGKKSISLPTVGDMLSGEFQPVARKIKPASDTKILTVEDLTVRFAKKKKTLFSSTEYVTAVDSVSFEMFQGECLGIVGESGSGKSTVANCLSGLIQANEGTMNYDGQEISRRILSGNRDLRRRIQLVFQDPYSSLNPRMSVGNALREPLLFHNVVPVEKVKSKVSEYLSMVGLDDSYSSRYPHQLSGGQRQRVCIARALTVEPDLLICDECVSALDVSVQAQILNLLDHLKNLLGLNMIFISHDLNVVHYICDRILVMKEGRIVERGTYDKILDHPENEYTMKLIKSMPGEIFK